MAGLLLLCAIPVIAGGVRLTEISTGPEVTPANARFVATPIPVFLHIIGATLYGVLGAFQFATTFRRRKPGWHRAAGWLLIPAGLTAGLSGLWMTVFYPHPVGDGDLLTGFRLVFGSASVASIVLGMTSIMRRDITQHRAWMLRGYAIAMGAGTQVVTTLPWVAIVGPPDEQARAWLMFAGWAINVAVAEWIIRRRMVPSARASRTGLLAAA